MLWYACDLVISSSPSWALNCYGNHCHFVSSWALASGMRNCKELHFSTLRLFVWSSWRNWEKIHKLDSGNWSLKPLQSLPMKILLLDAAKRWKGIHQEIDAIYFWHPKLASIFYCKLPSTSHPIGWSRLMSRGNPEDAKHLEIDFKSLSSDGGFLEICLPLPAVESVDARLPLGAGVCS